jgi:hypothetical protein
MNQWFEKVAALIFLLLLVGLVGFLTFVPLPPASEKAVLMIIGGLMALCTQALPKLFGNNKEAELDKRVSDLTIKYNCLQDTHDRLMELLVTRHIIEQQGVVARKEPGRV